MKITKDSFIPIINGCMFRYGCLFNPESIVSNEKITNYLKYLISLNKDFNLFECIFIELIKISTNGLDIKNGYELYTYVFTGENLKYNVDKYDFVNMTDKKAIEILLKNFEILKESKSKLPIYKNILAITLYKIGKLK